MSSGKDPSGREPGEHRIALHREELSVGKRTVERGTVRIETEVREHPQEVEQTLDRETVEITRVPVGRPVDAAPEPRQEGDTLIVPILEEQLVVTKRLVLMEELHIRKRTETRVERITETLRSEEAVVTRHDVAPSDSPNPEQE